MESGSPSGSGITVVIPTIPPRVNTFLPRALQSVFTQTFMPETVIVETDQWRTGGAATRNRGLQKVTTPWVAFLDDDDEFLPYHLNNLMDHANATNSDYVYSWFLTAPAGQDPFPARHFTDEFNPADPIETTITILVKTQLAQAIGMHPHAAANVMWPGEDRRFTQQCIQRGAKISHLVQRTWIWHHDSLNTSGLATRW
jgi:glycosyl transferase family 2